jgi:hypothetical protein
VVAPELRQPVSQRSRQGESDWKPQMFLFSLITFICNKDRERRQLLKKLSSDAAASAVLILIQSYTCNFGTMNLRKSIFPRKEKKNELTEN